MKKRLDITVVVPVASIEQAKKASLVTIRDGNEFRYWTWKSIVDEKEKFDFNFIKSPANLNLPQSLNSVVDKIKTKYVAFLHHDLWLLENGHWLEKAVKYMDSLPNVGVCGIVGKTFEKQETPMIRRYKDTNGKEYTQTQGDSIGYIAGYCMVSAMGKGETLIRNYRRKGFFRFPVGTKGRWYSNVNIFGRYFEKPIRVQTLDCVVMIVKTEVFKKILFDERFPYRCDCMCEDFCLAVNYYFGLQNYVLPLATWHKPCWKRSQDYQAQFRNQQHYIQVKALGKKWKNKIPCILSTSFWTGGKIDDDIFLDWYAEQWKETKKNIRVPVRFRTFPEDNKKHVLLVEDLKKRLQKSKPFIYPRPYVPLEVLKRGSWKVFQGESFPDEEVDWNNDPIRPTSDIKPTVEIIKIENKFYKNINFILCINNRVIGFVNAIYIKIYNPFKIWRMGWIVVKPEFRGLGFGIFLIEKLLNYFKYRRVYTTVHKRLIKWYESKFKGRWYVVGKSIDSDGYVVDDSYVLMTKPEYRKGKKKTSIHRNIVTAFVLMNRRSGTSMTMGLLKILGADIGKNIKPANDLNETGYFEDKNWLRLQMEIVTKVRKWNLSQQIMVATPPPAVDNGIRRKANKIRLNWKGDFCALKVVSTSFKYIYPLFENVRCILPIRMPYSSFKSVARYWSCNNLRIPRMIDHWKYSASESYLNLNACSINDVPLLILDYDWVLQNPRLAVTKIISFLDLNVSRKIKQQAINFIQKRLKHY